MDKGKKAKPTQRRWHTVTEMRRMQDDELRNLAKSYGYSDEDLAKKCRADIIVNVMTKQLHLKNEGYEFEKGGQQ